MVTFTTRAKSLLYIITRKMTQKPLPPRSSFGSRKECVEKITQMLIEEGKPSDQAYAIANEHCDQ